LAQLGSKLYNTDYEIPRNCEATPLREWTANFLQSDTGLSDGERLQRASRPPTLLAAGLEKFRPRSIKTKEMERDGRGKLVVVKH
jgi:hypothetical protein